MAPDSEKEKRDSRTYAIIGAAIEVHRQRGCGFLKSVYQEAMALEMTARDLPYWREVRQFPLTFPLSPVIGGEGWVRGDRIPGTSPFSLL
jgi:hypothetical protein